MIKVLVKRNEQNGFISSIEVKGHADSAPRGKDLVCAAVSAIVTGGMNALTDKNNYSFLYESGHVIINSKSEVNYQDSVILNTIIIQLQSVKESNPEFIEIKEIC